MLTIGVRELRQNASRYLRLVEGGETIRVTDRGRPVALLVPVPGEGGYARLVADGRIRPGTGSPAELGMPEPLPGGTRELSEHLEDLREDER